MKRKDIEYRDIIDSRLRYWFDKEREGLNEKAEHKNYIDMEVYLADIKRYRETAETQKMLLDKIIKEDEELKKENANLREENEKLKKDLAETQKIGESRRQECKLLRRQVSLGFSDFGGYGDEQET